MKKLVITLLCLLCLTGCSSNSISLGTNTILYKNTVNDETYQTFYSGLSERKDSITFKGYYDDIYQFTDLCHQIELEHPEIFCFPNYFTLTTNFLTNTTTLKIQYDLTKEEVTHYKTYLENVRNDFLTQARGLSNEQIVNLAYDYIIESTDYDYDELNSSSINVNSHSIVGAFYYHKCVCSGYAKAFQYLLQSAGIPCRYIAGETANGRHAWNSVNLNGKTCYFDATWDDNELPRRYYGLTYEQISIDHFEG